MFKTSDELKAFISWCQENKVKSFKNNNIEFELSEIAFLPSNEDLKEIRLEDSKTLVDLENMTNEEYEDLLFHSSN